MAIRGELEVTIKINQLPTDVVTDTNGWKEFKIDCAGRVVSVSMFPRMWTKLEEAAKNPVWVAAIIGRMGPSQGEGFTLIEPGLRVSLRKPPTPTEGA